VALSGDHEHGQVKVMSRVEGRDLSGAFVECQDPLGGSGQEAGTNHQNIVTAVSCG
jgi:hypothetical protein